MQGEGRAFGHDSQKREYWRWQGDGIKEGRAEKALLAPRPDTPPPAVQYIHGVSR